MKLIDIIGAIVFSLSRTDVTPSSMLYLAIQGKFGIDLNVYSEALGIAVGSDLVSNIAHGLTLTDKGEKLRVKLEAQIAALKAQQDQRN